MLATKRMTELALAVVLPLLACLLAVPLGRRAMHLLWAVVPLTLWVATSVALRVAHDGPVHHVLGGWAAPLGITLRADGLAAAFLLLGALVAGLTGIFAAHYFHAPTETRKGFAFWPLFHACWAAVNAIFVGGDLFNLYVALELLTLAAVAMVALQGASAHIEAAIRYLIYALSGSLAFLAGTALLYSAHGTLDLELLGALATPDRATIVAAALLTGGLFAKAAIFPLHAWLPPAHGGAPAPASALLSALVVKAAFYILLRLWFQVLPPPAAPGSILLGLMGGGAVLFGSLQALRQQRLKRIVAYSTVAQIGYLFLVFPLAAGGVEAHWRSNAWTGAVLLALAHGLAKAAMFLAAGAMMRAAGDDRLSSMTGLGRATPMACFAFGLAALSLMGLPPSGGFLGKYLMLTAAFGSGAWWWAVMLLAGGLLSAAYLFRAIGPLMMQRSADAPPPRVIHWSLQLTPLLLAAAAVLLGLAGAIPSLLQVGAPLGSGDFR